MLLLTNYSKQQYHMGISSWPPCAACTAAAAALRRDAGSCNPPLFPLMPLLPLSPLSPRSPFGPASAGCRACDRMVSTCGRCDTACMQLHAIFKSYQQHALLCCPAGQTVRACRRLSWHGAKHHWLRKPCSRHSWRILQVAACPAQAALSTNASPCAANTP